MFKTPAGRLTEEGVREIRRRRESGEMYTQIVKALEVSLGTVFNVCKRKTWKWLP